MGKPTGFLEYERVEAKGSFTERSASKTLMNSTPLYQRQNRENRAHAAWTAAFPFCQSGMTM